MLTMDGDQASRFVSSLVKSIQALCNGYIDFSSSIEVIGHIHLNIDRSVKLDYVLTEEVSKSVSEGATVFASHSYHSQPPSSAVSKNTSDSSNRNRSKQSQGDDGDSAGFRSSTTDVHTPSKPDSHALKRSSSHYGENSESSHSGSFVNTGDTLSLKQESPQKLCRTPESLDRRRKSAHGPQSHFHHQSPSSAVKRSRHSDNVPEKEPQEFEVIEIKEEPDEAPAVFFGNSSSHMAAGQDLQTPDFSNVVMESLDRVSQVEGTDLVGEGGPMQQPFPVMMHSNPGMSSSSSGASSHAGPSQSDPQSQQSLASTSGMLSEAELRLLRRRQKNAMHARLYRQRAKLSEEKHQMLRAKAKERQRRYVQRTKERQLAYAQSISNSQGFYPPLPGLPRPIPQGSPQNPLGQQPLQAQQDLIPLQALPGIPMRPGGAPVMVDMVRGRDRQLRPPPQ